MKPLQWAFFLSGAVLQIGLISSLLRGAYRQFPVLFGYAVTLFLVTMFEAAVIFGPGSWTEATSRYYWVNESILQILIFSLVISLIARAVEENPARAPVQRALILATIGVAAISSYMVKAVNIQFLMTEISRNLSFCAVILNLILWLTLIRYRRPDRRLLLISGGLGIQMTGEAIGHTLRQLSRQTMLAGNIFMVVAQLLCLLIWWQAFRQPMGKKSEALARAARQRVERKGGQPDGRRRGRSQRSAWDGEVV